MFAIGASALVLAGEAAMANAGDEAIVTEQVTSAQLSCRHSGGRVETREQFIAAVMTRKAVVKSLAFPELEVSVAGNAAIARQGFTLPAWGARRRMGRSAPERPVRGTAARRYAPPSP